MNQRETHDRFEMPQNVKDFAEAGFDQARKAFENFMSAAQKTATSLEDQGHAAQASARHLSGKAIEYAEANIRASLDHAERLLKVKDIPEALKLHGEHIQERMRALAEQASEMGQANNARGDGRGKAEVGSNRGSALQN
jgi:phasin